jgi:hypothetical protein
MEILFEFLCTGAEDVIIEKYWYISLNHTIDASLYLRMP